MVDINAPFEEYMQQCQAFMLNRVKNDPITAIVFDDISALEVIWARRYWFHHNGAQHA
jgi:hypothetical protein